MKVKVAVFVFIVLIFNAMPAQALQEAILPAYALVSEHQSSIKEYQELKEKRKNASARKLLTSNKVFICPRDTKVEVVKFGETLAKVKLSRLGSNAEPVTMYFWTLTKQLKMVQ